jgi:DNA polymerase I-like protein with 3'-5' exonuclease and polymerase domains
MTRPNLRRQIRVRKGRKFVGFDFAQIEARVIALISGDPYLCRIFAEGLDPHIENSRIIWPQFDSLDKDSQKQLREQSKPIGYGAMYLAQVETLHKQMLKEGHNIKLVDLAKAINKLMTAMAGLVRWQHATVAQASQPPYEIKDFVLGRRRTWPMGQVEGTEAVNFGVQTAAASIMNTGMARIMEVIHLYPEVFAIAQIHDACVFECWEDDAEPFSRLVKQCFEQEYERDGRIIRFTIDLKIGDDWSQV